MTKLNVEALYRSHYRYYVKMLTRPCRGNVEVAEDLVQEGFIKAMEKAHTYDPEKGKVKPWLTSIMWNCFRASLKKDKARNAPIVAGLQPEDVVDFIDHAENDSQRRIAQESIYKVKNSKSRRVLELFFLAGYSSIEISQIENVTQTNVTTIVSRFKETLG